MSNESKTYFIFLLTLFLGYLLFHNIRSILPFTQNDEYYIYRTISKENKNISWKTIHSKDCPFEKSSWFKKKHSKYDIILENDTYICNQCIDDDEAKKLLMLHGVNLQNLYKRYRSHYSAEEADSLIMEYNTNVNLKEVYYGEW